MPKTKKPNVGATMLLQPLHPRYPHFPWGCACRFFGPRGLVIFERKVFLMRLAWSLGFVPYIPAKTKAHKPSPNLSQSKPKPNPYLKPYPKPTESPAEPPLMDSTLSNLSRMSQLPKGPGPFGAMTKYGPKWENQKVKMSALNN